MNADERRRTVTRRLLDAKDAEIRELKEKVERLREEVITADARWRNGIERREASSAEIERLERELGAANALHRDAVGEIERLRAVLLRLDMAVNRWWKGGLRDDVENRHQWTRELNELYDAQQDARAALASKEPTP